ncbi:MAG: Rid family detoxifying hydrolase [Candidatus Caldarchaeum sp.]|uniref:Deaminase n=1 Tax=Caldiarchaeum subterraneum TaxID=311458 RepID=A0A7C5Q7X6_CALS0
MAKQVVSTEKAPKPVGPYSQAIRAGNFLFLSGQIAINPATGNIDGNDVKSQTRRILENAQAILKSVGRSLDDVVKATVYLTNPEHFKEMNEVYRDYFRNGPPARTTVVAQLPLTEALVEIDFIAYLGD